MIEGKLGVGKEFVTKSHREGKKIVISKGSKSENVEKKNCC